jgi:hypothetical protein
VQVGQCCILFVERRLYFMFVPYDLFYKETTLLVTSLISKVFYPTKHKACGQNLSLHLRPF